MHKLRNPSCVFIVNISGLPKSIELLTCLRYAGVIMNTGALLHIVASVANNPPIGAKTMFSPSSQFWLEPECNHFMIKKSYCLDDTRSMADAFGEPISVSDSRKVRNLWLDC